MTVTAIGGGVPHSPDATVSRGVASGTTRPALGDVLRRARHRSGFSLREVERQSGISDTRLSQIERGVIRRPDVSVLVELARVYSLDHHQVTEWAGHSDHPAPRGASDGLAGTVLRLFVNLGPRQQHDVLRYLETLRRETDRNDLWP